MFTDRERRRFCGTSGRRVGRGAVLLTLEARAYHLKTALKTLISIGALGLGVPGHFQRAYYNCAYSHLLDAISWRGSVPASQRQNRNTHITRPPVFLSLTPGFSMKRSFALTPSDRFTDSFPLLHISGVCVSCMILDCRFSHCSFMHARKSHRHNSSFRTSHALMNPPGCTAYVMWHATYVTVSGMSDEPTE